PNPSNAAADVALSATADDTAAGSASVTQAEYFIDITGNPAVGSGTSLSIEPMGAPIVSLDTMIPAATLATLSDGDHVVSVRSGDAQGNWGDFATITLTIDKSGPTTSNVTVNPALTNGAQGVNSSTPAVRLAATFADNMSNLERAEGFIDNIGADGTGFLFVANDGRFDSLGESGYADIPLTTISQLSDGVHTLFVHARDAVGNWGDTGSVTFTVDRTAPIVAGITINPNPTNGALVAAVTASVLGNGNDIAQAEWFIGADPGVGNGTPMNVNAGTLTADVPVDGLASDVYPLWVRARDAAGNWSNAAATTLEVTQPGPALTGALYFSTQGNGAVSQVPGPYDNADIYNWSGAVFSRIFNANLEGLPGNANIDGLSMVSGNQFYISFAAADTNVPGLGLVQDEDVVYYNQGTWSVFFDGTAQGLTGNGQNIDAVSVVGGVLYFSTQGNGPIPGVVGPFDDADIYAWNGSIFERVLDASEGGLPNNADIDGLDIIDANTFYASFSAANTTLPGPITVQDEDVIEFVGNNWTVYFDGTAEGFTANNQDVSAVDVP
ncbi:MAG: hypothetical protein KDD84_23870, partial [Caldilineaceae bacterium]|nr:hypothetical protein [Caldilineaceae bacterium]